MSGSMAKLKSKLRTNFKGEKHGQEKTSTLPRSNSGFAPTVQSPDSPYDPNVPTSTKACKVSLSDISQHIEVDLITDYDSYRNAVYCAEDDVYFLRPKIPEGDPDDEFLQFSFKDKADPPEDIYYYVWYSTKAGSEVFYLTTKGRSVLRVGRHYVLYEDLPDLMEGYSQWFEDWKKEIKREIEKILMKRSAVK